MKPQNGITSKQMQTERNVPSDGQILREVDNLFLFYCKQRKE